MYQFVTNKCGPIWLMLPLPVYQSCLTKENSSKDPGTVTVVNTLFSQRSLNH